DGHEGALGHVVAVVDWLAGADAGDQLVVLVLVHAVVLDTLRRLVLPGLLALNRILHHVAGAPGAGDVVGRVVVATVLLPAVAEALDAVGEFVDHAVVVEDVAELRLGAHLPAAEADRLDRVLVLHGPGDFVQA